VLTEKIDLIHDERNSPLPFTATGASPETPRNAYELLKYELVYFIHSLRDVGKDPTDEELQVEACRIVYGAEVLSHSPLSSAPSWLRDLVMSSQDAVRQAQMSPIKSHTDSRMNKLKINGKDNPFEECEMERQLRDFVKARSLLGLAAMDRELQVEASKIVGRMEESSNTPSDKVANFLLRLIHKSKAWLCDFRQRAHLPRSEDLADEAVRSKDQTTIDSTILNYSRLERELAEYVRNQRGMGVEPDDSSLQRQARLIVYEYDDGWNQTAADNAEWLAAFKLRHMMDGGSPRSSMSETSPLTLESLQGSSTFSPAATTSATTSALQPNALLTGFPTLAEAPCRPMPAISAQFFLNDANCYRRLAKELTRYVNSTMSPNNPNCHVPSDQELQHQSRWILYDE
jgi:hypothetical protein